MLDLFAGMKGASEAQRRAGWRVVTVDNDRTHEPDELADVRRWSWKGEAPTLVWASPPCQEFSLARWPRYPPSSLAFELVKAALRIVRETKPRFWVIENVMGACPYLTPVLGSYLSYGPFYLWGRFPHPDGHTLYELDRHRKMEFRSAKLRARVPLALSDGIRRAIERELAVFDVGEASPGCAYCHGKLGSGRLACLACRSLLRRDQQRRRRWRLLDQALKLREQLDESQLGKIHELVHLAARARSFAGAIADEASSAGARPTAKRC